MKKFFDEFLPSVAWPAVAGNVAWSVATLAIDQGINVDTRSRLGVLVVFAVYLSAEWYRGKQIPDTNLIAQWFDLLLVICIVWFAIATQANKGLPGVALLLILLGVGVGHLFGVWPPKGTDKGNKPFGWLCLIAAGILGLAWGMNRSWDWGFALAGIAIVLVVWALVRRGKTE